MLVLDIVKAIGVGVPCVDSSPGDRMAVRYDLSGDIERFARHPLGEVGPVRGPLRRALDMEWSEHRLLGDILGAAMALGDDDVFRAFAFEQFEQETGEAVHRVGRRSEEHTSELQSLMCISYAVFCLKTKTKTTIYRMNKID